jgi:hypothetical protein
MLYPTAAIWTGAASAAVRPLGDAAPHATRDAVRAVVALRPRGPDALWDGLCDNLASIGVRARAEVNTMRKRMFRVLLLAAAVVPACRANPAPPLEIGGGRDVIASQNRINRYFHQNVVPKLKTCWSRLQGEGTIDLEFVYRRAGAEWAWEGLSVTGSTLRDDQTSLAQQCMRDAASATSFRVEGDDGEAPEFVVDWRWPVPWPQDVTALARMAGAGGIIWGDCGLGKLSKCKDCLPDKKTKKLTCQSVCIGYTTCTPNPDGNGCTLGPKSPACVSGYPLGTVGGAVIY